MIKKIFGKNKPFPNTSLLILVFTLLLFILKGYVYLDPDFGWRIKAGEIYWNQGIPKTDPFSYTMPSFPWVDHAWGTTLFFYLINSSFGYLGLSFVMAILVVAVLLISSNSISKIFYHKDFYKNTEIFLGGKILPKLFIKIDFDKLHFFASLSFLLVASVLFTFFGIRAQVVSWFMFSLLLYWLSDKERWKKVRLFAPAFFLLWTNLHGGFALGIFVLILYLALKFYRDKKVDLLESLILLFCLLSTFINPYKGGVWREVWSSVSDTNLRWKISEWMPALTMFDVSMVFLISLSLIFIWKYRKNFNLFELSLYSFLLVQAIGSRRQLPLWAIATLPLTTKGIFYFWKDSQKIKNAVSRFGNVYKTAWLLVLFLFFFQAFFAFKEAFFIGKGGFYPTQAVSYLSQNPPGGEIFSDYGWGGYLILNLPKKKVFIDGRMPSWRWDKYPDRELSSAFDTYNSIPKGETDYKEIFDKFGIDTVLTTKDTKSSASNFYQKAENFLTLFGWKKTDFRFLETLEKDNWKKVYEDNVSVIYQKN